MNEVDSSTPVQHRLPRQLGLRDLVLTQIVCVVGSGWVGVAAGLGPAETLFWVGAMVVFYVPMAASVIVLNRVMPLEGGLYVWAREAFGDLFGFLTAWNLWVYGIAVTATILYAIPTELSYMIGPAAAGLPENRPAAMAIVTAAVAGIALAALRGLEVGKWINNIGGMAMLMVFAVLILLPLWSVARHEPLRAAPFALARPPLDMRTLALFGEMLFGALCGLEYIAIFAGESRQPARSIARSVWISSPMICAMFILGSGSVVAYIAPRAVDYIAPIPQTLRAALGHAGVGNLFAAGAIFLLQLRLLGAASYAFTGVTRLPMTAGWDHLVPAWFTRLHVRRRTPSNSIVCAAGLVFVMIVLAGLGVHAQEAFQLLTNAGLTHYELAYMAMFAVPLFGRAGLRRHLPGWFRVTSMAGFCSTAFSLLISAYPFVRVVNAGGYAARIVGTVLASNCAGLVFYGLRRPAGKRPELEAES